MVVYICTRTMSSGERLHGGLYLHPYNVIRGEVTWWSIFAPVQYHQGRGYMVVYICTRTQKAYVRNCYRLYSGLLK